MNQPAAPISGIAASLGQATVYQAENYHRPKERRINPSSAAGGLKYKKSELRP
jgi:hypothetical protein